MHEWIRLTRYIGENVENPTDKDLKDALAELFLAKDDEHPDAWIECGSENGPLYTLSVFSSGYALFTKYSDADMTDELEHRRTEDVTAASGLMLWKDLIDGNET